MITKLNNKIAENYYQQLVKEMPDIDFKFSLNEQTGDFFYDPWKIKKEFENTVWDKILKSLGTRIGEARLIKMDIEQCYTKHADIDNRWHYPLTGNNSYLVDLTTNQMHSLDKGVWYYMDASCTHSAVNFGCEQRVSLVVRDLLIRGISSQIKKVEIVSKNLYNDRFLFDTYYSPFLNVIDKKGKLNNFSQSNKTVSFETCKNVVIPTVKGFIINEYQ